MHVFMAHQFRDKREVGGHKVKGSHSTWHVPGKDSQLELYQDVRVRVRAWVFLMKIHI